MNYSKTGFVRLVDAHALNSLVNVSYSEIADIISLRPCTSCLHLGMGLFLCPLHESLFNSDRRKIPQFTVSARSTHYLLVELEMEYIFQLRLCAN